MISNETNVVCDADLYSEIFTEKNLQPLSCFHIYSDFKHILKIFQYMIQWKSSHRRENYQRIKELFVENSREESKECEYLVTYGARTALDLYFQAKNYPKGSEVLMTAISTDGVIEAVRGKNYPNRNEIKIVPVDIQWETMGPTLVNIKSLITPKTVAIVLCYPFGIIYDIEKIASFCKQKGIDVIEDATEAFSGLSTPGSSFADLTLLSFGMLRHYSSFGGAVAVVRNNKEIFRKMLQIEKMYPVDKSIVYLTRVFKAIRLMTLLNSKYYTLNLPRLLQQYKIVSYIRKPIWKLRQRISLPCLRLLATRLEEIDPIESLQKYERLSKFTFEGVSPGCQAVRNTYSFYPVIFNEPSKAISALWNRGYQVLTGQEVHCLAKSDNENIKENLTPEAKSIIESIVLLPITLETSTKDIEKVQKEVSEFVNACNRGLVLSMKQLVAKI